MDLSSGMGLGVAIASRAWMAQERSSSRSTCSLDTAVVCAACFVGVGLKPLQRGVI